MATEPEARPWYRRGCIGKLVVVLNAIAMGLAGLAWVVVSLGNDVMLWVEDDQPSRSLGTSSDGSLEHGKRLPTMGLNYSTHSKLLALLGRNSVHGDLRDCLIDSWNAVLVRLPGRVFVYGEAGWPSGGPFWPHETHQNGLCIDFMVPLLTPSGVSERLPTSPLNQWGYGLELDERGRLGNLVIDWEAMAVHLQEVHRACTAEGFGVRTVIFAPELRERLLDHPEGAVLQGVLPFSTQPAWVRHDDHYHVEFTR